MSTTTYTAADQINRALRQLGVLAEGEVPSASTSNDALMALNQMIDSWNTERLSVFSTMDQVFTWPSGQVTQSLGPTGDFVGIRPITLDSSTYYIDPGTNISYPIEIINQDQYDAIALKTVTSTYPEVLFINMSFPNVELFVYPVPTTDLEWHFISVAALAEPALLTTVLSFPPGYLRAFTYNLAMEIAPEFGVEAPKQVQRIAIASKRDLKRINDPKDEMSMPVSLLSNRYDFNIFTGYPQ